MKQNEIYSAVCPKCKKEVLHIPYLIRINKGIKLISMCPHQIVAKRYTNFQKLKSFDMDRAFEEAQKQLAKEEEDNK